MSGPPAEREPSDLPASMSVYLRDRQGQYAAAYVAACGLHRAPTCLVELHDARLRARERARFYGSAELYRVTRGGLVLVARYRCEGGAVLVDELPELGAESPIRL